MTKESNRGAKQEGKEEATVKKAAVSSLKKKTRPKDPLGVKG